MLGVSYPQNHAFPAGGTVAREVSKDFTKCHARGPHRRTGSLASRSARSASREIAQDPHMQRVSVCVPCA